MKPSASLLVVIPSLVVILGIMNQGRALAIPNSFIGNGPFLGPIIPAHPRFGANLTGDFLSLAAWENRQLPGPWETRTITQGIQHDQMLAMPVLFGAVPDSVIARREEGAIREIVITYLDAGTFFPFRAGGEKGHAQRQAGIARRTEFDSHWHRLDRALRERLEAGCGPGKQAIVGRSELLRTVFVDYAWDAFRLRLARREGHSIALHLSLLDTPPPEEVTGVVRHFNQDQRTDWLQSHVVSNEIHQLRIEGIPTFDQGFTPYCGVHALAMVAHYHGLRLLPGELAAGAEFSNTGSARGSQTLDLYEAVAQELGMTLSRSSRFDARRVERAIASGLPVIVWRRVSLEREKAHASFAAQVAVDPTLKLPAPRAGELASLPPRQKKGSPSHASVIHGIDQENDSVLYLEPWGEASLERQMRFEEMETSTYAVFYLEP